MPTGQRAAEVFNQCGCNAPETIDRATAYALAQASSQEVTRTGTPFRPGAGSGR